MSHYHVYELKVIQTGEFSMQSGSLNRKVNSKLAEPENGVSSKQMLSQLTARVEQQEKK